VAVKDFGDLLRVSIEEKVDMVFVGAGLPIRGIPVKELRDSNVKFVPIVSSARAAKLICRYWEKNYNDIPDGLVVEGPDAGGHLGFKKEQIDHPDHKLEKIFPEVISETKVFEKIFNRKIPVIAAGGIFTGEDIYKFLNLGAAGVQMGTRFVATHECDADIRFKKLYLECRKKDIIIIKSPVGLPGRAIKNNFIEDIDSGKKQFFNCPWKCLDSCDAQNARYCISIALNNARKGNFRYGFAFAGSNAYKINRIVSVKELLKDLTKEYLAAAEKGTISLLNELTVALEKLNTLKDEYAKTVDKNIRIFKDEYVKVLEKGSETLREEYGNILMKINNLKKEYMDYFNKVNSLKSQLSKFFA
jgi:nitronate monooxygenase